MGNKYSYESIIDVEKPAVQRAVMPAAVTRGADGGGAGGGGVILERCCVYCGHGLFASPKVLKVRCPKCFEELPVRDVVLTGAVREEKVLTAGKIIVAEDGRVEAELVSCVVEVMGWVLGDILASETCRVKGTGRVAGRILCRRLELEAGARVEGFVELVRR